MNKSGNATLCSSETGCPSVLCACTGALDNAYRLACLHLVYEHEGLMPETDVVGRAAELFDFVSGVTVSSRHTQLYVIENREEPKNSYSAENRFLCVVGSWKSWGAERHAYRFCSFNEASEALVKSHPELGGDMTIVPLPLGTELF